MPRSLDTVQTEYLVLTAQFGDVAAFAELLRRWLPIMRRHAARLTADPTATDDVVQEACLALVSALKRLDDPSRAHGWMLRIVSNKAADWVRTRRRERVLTHSLPVRSPPDAHRDSPEARFEHTIQAAEIRAACLALPIHLRTIVSLFYGEHLPIPAIAAALGSPAGTIKSRLHEARALIRQACERSPS